MGQINKLNNIFLYEHDSATIVSRIPENETCLHTIALLYFQCHGSVIDNMVELVHMLYHTKCHFTAVKFNSLLISPSNIV